MASEQSRLECLRLASERVGPAASIETLYAEARRLVAFVDGYDDIVDHGNGKFTAGKRA